MSKHTKEPWELFPIDNPTQIKAKYGSPYNDESELLPVVKLGVGKNTLANAKLIAQAPNLLEALILAKEAFSQYAYAHGTEKCEAYFKIKQEIEKTK